MHVASLAASVQNIFMCALCKGRPFLLLWCVCSKLSRYLLQGMHRAVEVHMCMMSIITQTFQIYMTHKDKATMALVSSLFGRKKK